MGFQQEGPFCPPHSGKVQPQEKGGESASSTRSRVSFCRLLATASAVAVSKDTPFPICFETLQQAQRSPKSWPQMKWAHLASPLSKRLCQMDSAAITPVLGIGLRVSHALWRRPQTSGCFRITRYWFPARWGMADDGRGWPEMTLLEVWREPPVMNGSLWLMRRSCSGPHFYRKIGRSWREWTERCVREAKPSLASGLKMRLFLLSPSLSSDIYF